MSPKGIFIGLNTIDNQFLIDCEINENSKYKAEKTGLFVGGPATNAAICFSYLNGKSKLYTPIGNHHFSNFIYEDLNNLKIEITDLNKDIDAEPTMASIITTKNNGNRTVFSYHPKPLSIQQVNNNNLDNSDIILVDGFYIDTTIELLKNRKTNSTPIVLDGGSWKPNMEKLLKYIDIAICSENFLPPGTKNQDDIFNFLHDYGIKYAAITQGEKPINYSINNSKGQIFIEPVEVIDTLGAGDFFHGAFCYYFAQDNDFIGSLLKASKIAGKSCKYFGTREWMYIDNGNGIEDT